MTKRMVFIMDDKLQINVKKDSTMAMIDAALRAGWRCYYCQQHDLQANGTQILAKLAEIEAATTTLITKPTQLVDLAGVDVVMMRKDPPFNMEYIYTTYLLDLVEQQGVLVVNKPQSLRDFNEKAAILKFPDCIPPTLVARNVADIKAFIAQHHDVILKPLDGMGGKNIFRVSPNEPNLNVILETMSHDGTKTIMAQQYLADIARGDKRILLIDGEAVPFALARIASGDDFRANLAAGGKGVGQPLSERDHWLCQQIGPVCKQHGLMFVGLDVIGDYVTEINVTSPTCIRELNDAFDLDIASQLISAIAKRCSEKVITNL